MAVVKPVIFQVVGYQNSGKTTFLTKMIAKLSEKGWKVVTIKHHGHGGQPDLREEKDSSKHMAAGAAASLVEGGGRMILHADHSNCELSEQIKLVSFFQPDFILIEGHKLEVYPKVVLIRDEEDVDLFQKVSNIKAVLYWQENDLQSLHQYIPCYHIADENGLNWLLSDLIKDRQQ